MTFPIGKLATLAPLVDRQIGELGELAELDAVEASPGCVLVRVNVEKKAETPLRGLRNQVFSVQSGRDRTTSTRSAVTPNDVR